MKAVSFVGYKKSGKTSLILQLSKLFKDNGYHVGIVKFSHHSLDKQESDTAKLTENADAVIGLTDSESSIFWPQRKFLQDLLPLVDAEILLIEGGKHLGYVPRIVLADGKENYSGLESSLNLGIYGNYADSTLPRYNEVQELYELVLQKGFILPGLDCGACSRETCADLAADIIAGKADPEDCQSVQTDFQIKINGHQLSMNPFVRSIIGGSIQGMIANLKGYAPGTVEIHMEV